MSNINKINGLDIDAATAQYVAAGNVDGPLGYNSVQSSVTASYISPTFISASAAASGFGSGGGSVTASVALSASIKQTTGITGYRVVLADTDGGGGGTYNTALYYDHNGIIYDATADRLTVGQLSATGLTGSFAGTITNATSASYAATASYSTTLGAEITNPVVGMLRLRNSNSTTISTISDLTASLAASASYLNPLNQNVTINGNLQVFGTASYTNVSSSELNIGTSLITVNTSNPANRFGGLSVIDSGSTPRTSGSILFDSVNDQWVFIHNTAATTSSIFIQSPQTYNDLGNEINLTTNRVPKSTNAEHIGDSNISDTGTVVSINSNTQVTGSLRVTAGITGSLQGTATNATTATSATQIYVAENTSPGLYNVPVYPDGGFDGNNTLYSSGIGYDFATNALSVTRITSSLGMQGTASYAVQALTASYALVSAGVAGGVTSIIAGDGISVDQSTGNVTITNTGGGGGGGTNLGLVYAVSLGYLMP
jgi:hypothetical protein